jgi:hypothetical protein
MLIQSDTAPIVQKLVLLAIMPNAIANPKTMSRT